MMAKSAGIRPPAGFDIEARRRFTSWLGRRSYAARVERFGIERIREIARENGKKGGRRRKVEKKAEA
jgi:hypothetical protein